ncbi:MAG: RICIN domain-containing protein [Gammaproteobacteria bacterium]
MAKQILALAALIIVFGVSSPSANADSPFPFAADALRNQNSNRCLSLVGNGTSNGTKSNQWTCNGAPSQRWAFQPVGPRASTFESQKFQIRSTHPGTTDKCLSLDQREGYGNGSHFLLWTCRGDHPAQAFYLWTHDSGSYNVILAASSRCLGVDYSDTGNTYGGINQWNCVNAVSQRWKLTSQEQFRMPLRGSGVNYGLHGPPYDNPWATDLFSGTRVEVAIGGIVRRAGRICGNGVRIEDSLGFNHLYCHGDRPTGLREGSYVAAGTYIFNKGNTGTGVAHLHYEVMWRPPGVSTSNFSTSTGYVPYCATSILHRVRLGSAVPSQRRSVGFNCGDGPF